MRLLMHHPPNHVRICHLKNLPANNAEQVAFCIVLCKDAAEAAKFGPARGSQHHDVLVLGWDGQVDKGLACQVPLRCCLLPSRVRHIARGARMSYQPPFQTTGTRLCLCPTLNSL